MPDSTQSQPQEPLDPLSMLLGRIGLRGEVYARPVGCGDWLINTSGHGRASFHLVSSGTCWLHMDPSYEPVQLLAGDVVFFPADTMHQLTPGAGQPSGQHRLPGPGPGEQTQLVCGLYRSRDRELERILRGLPRVVIARADGRGLAMARTITSMAEEAQLAEPGTQLVLNALSDALLALLLRESMAQGKVQDGLLGGMNDARLSPALAAMHAAPGQDWSVDALAGKAMLSRSAFAERFQRILGTSPASYLAHLRMNEARTLLQDNEVSVAQIAERLGYATEAAFRRAFRRVTGTTPGDARRRA